MHRRTSIFRTVISCLAPLLSLGVACSDDEVGEPRESAAPGETEMSMDSMTAPDESDASGDSNDTGGRLLEVSLSFDSFATDTFMCVVHEGIIIFGVTTGASDAGESFQIAGSLGGDVRQQVSINLGSEVWSVQEEDDPSESVGMFIELEVDADRGTARGRAHVEERSFVDSDGTDTLTFNVRC